MPITVSIYEFLAYTIPGTFYLFVAAYVCNSFRWVTIEPEKLLNLTATQAIIAAIVSFIVGVVFDRVTSILFELLGRKYVAQTTLDEFKFSLAELGTKVELKFSGKHWPVLLASIKREKPETGIEIERFNATHKLLKNVSFSLLTLSIVHIIQVFRLGTPLKNLAIATLLSVASFILILQALKFRRWFYSSIYEAIVARHIKVEDLVVTIQEQQS